MTLYLTIDGRWPMALPYEGEEFDAALEVCAKFVRRQNLTEKTRWMIVRAGSEIDAWAAQIDGSQSDILHIDFQEPALIKCKEVI